MIAQSNIKVLPFVPDKIMRRRGKTRREGQAHIAECTRIRLLGEDYVSKKWLDDEKIMTLILIYMQLNMNDIILRMFMFFIVFLK